MKKVLYVITKSNWGGAQKYVYDLAINIGDGFEVVVALGGDGPLNKKLEKSGIKTVKIKGLERNISFLDISIFFKLAKVYQKEKPDVVHLNSSKIGGLGTLAGRFYNFFKLPKNKLETIFTVHGFAFYEERNIISKVIIKILSYFTIIFSHKTILISQKEFEKAKKWPFVSKKIYLIYNGISDVEFKKKDESQAFLLPNKKADIWIGTISELHKNKGIEYTIKALGEINSNWVFVVIGDGEEKSNLLNLIEKLKLQDKVFLIGHIDDASKYLKAFNIFTLTSIKEGLPYVLLEAGLSRKAVIASDVGGIPEIIKHEKSGLLTKAKDIKDISKSLKALIDEKEKRILFGENLYTKVKESFSLESMLHKTYRLYE
ncbi:glycosyltransferase [Patescibacteria group bacterium]